MSDVRILFMGTPDFAAASLQALLAAGYTIVGVVTQPDRPVGRKQVLTPSPVKKLALEHGLTVLQPEKIKERAALAEVLALKPELIVTAAYGQILPPELLSAPRWGAINVHASLLPKYRGGAPMHRAIMAGERETGVTIMYMVEELDAGDMLSKVSVPIGERETVGSLHDKLAAAGAELLVNTIPRLLRGEIEPQPQDHQAATYAPTIKRSDEWIDWSKPAEVIYNQVRGLHPWPVAFTRFQGKIWKIWWVETVSSVETGERPGTILQRDSDGLIVACGVGSVKLVEIQPEGKRRMSMRDFLQGAGTQLQPGCMLGE